MLKDTAKSDSGTSQFVVVVRFKCFCKNVVKLANIATKPGCLGLVQIFSTFNMFSVANSMFYWFLFSFLSWVEFPVSLVNVI